MQKKVYELYKKFLVTITFPHYLTVFIKYRYEYGDKVKLSFIWL